MPPTNPEGRKPLTLAQRQALWRQRKAQQAEAWRDALEQIRDAKTLRDARKIATEALEQTPESKMVEIALPKVTPKQKMFLGFTAEFGYFGPNCGWSWQAPGIGFKMANILKDKGLLYRDLKSSNQPCWKLTALGMHTVKRRGY